MNPAVSQEFRAILEQGGETGHLILSTDWAATPIGPMEAWPQSLRTAVSICVRSRFPFLIWWGPELVKIYNDAYRTILGNKHPAALGSPGKTVWPEIWDVIGPMLTGVLERGEPTWSDNQLLILERSGYPEEGYFTFSYSPIADEEGIGGVFCAVTETTSEVIGARRMQTLNKLSKRTSGVRTVMGVMTAAAWVLEGNPNDVPFAELRVTHEGFAEPVIRAGEGRLKPDATVERLLQDQGSWDVLGPEVEVPGGAVSRDGQPAAVVIRIPTPGAELTASLVAGVSARRQLDDEYRNFLQLIADSIGAALTDAVAYATERRRVEALEQLDQAKTIFFSNISHEFRTPLTLALGPLEELLSRPSDTIDAADRERLEVAHRNSLRLLRLVNSLLDFATLEAGRAAGDFVATDLARLTYEVAGVFRSATEAAGLGLVVDCVPGDQAVFVDRDMWEKIVLNLLSNAFKHTFDGEIRVCVRHNAEHVTLQVSDTGTGIPPHELARIFERFHRVQASRSRTHEGTGIGLSLVKQLVELHGGTVAVESEVGRGTTFTVVIPTGSEHLPHEQVARHDAAEFAGNSSRQFVDEALRWLPETQAQDELPSEVVLEDGAGGLRGMNPAAGVGGAHILLVDDNRDMREYMSRLLSGHFRVETAANGLEALRAVRKKLPDLVITDVMMPEMDGVELLRTLRSDARTEALPVIMLSARAGEGSSVDGLDAGADDYLTKPFAARDLIARVKVNVLMSRTRFESAVRARDATVLQEELDRLSALEGMKSEFLRLASHELRGPIVVIKGYLDLLNSGLHGAVSDQDREIYGVLLAKIEEMSRLVDQMIETARLQDNKASIDEELLDLRVVVEDAIARVTTGTATQRRLMVDMQHAPVLVNGDPTRLAVVVRNLVENAIKYSPEISQVGVGCRAAGEFAEVVVSDRGIGIDDAEQARLFTSFGRIINSENSHIPGTGLGLYLSRRIARLHRGDIVLTSKKGEGTVVTLKLPLAGAQRNEKPRRRVKPGPKHPRSTTSASND